MYRFQSRLLEPVSPPRALRRLWRRACVIVPIVLLHALLFAVLALALLFRMSDGAAPARDHRLPPGGAPASSVSGLSGMNPGSAVRPVR